MNQVQALALIKAILDESSKAGLFQNMDSSFAAAQAFNIVSKIVNDSIENKD
jgi:hypothetical protein